MAKNRMCRVAGIAIENDKVLLHRPERRSYWSFPGGGCKFYETTNEAIIREIKEEIDSDIEVENLLWVVENIYMKKNIPNHELEFFYKIKISDRGIFEYDNFLGHEQGDKLIFWWCPLKDIKNIQVFPEFIKDNINNLPNNVQHFITK